MTRRVEDDVWDRSAMGHLDDIQPDTRADLHLDKADPSVSRALNGFVLRVRAAADAAGLPRGLAELVNVRASQLNGCAPCLDVHTRAALEAGETMQRLAVLPAWRETALFSDVERAALTIAEVVTTLPGAEEQLTAIRQAREVLSDEQYSALTWTAIAINAFNRVSILSRHQVRRRDW